MECCVFGCKRSTTSGIPGYFPFPSDPDEKNAWLYAIGRVGWEPSPISVLCSGHFVRDSYDFTASGLVLKITASPTVINRSAVITAVLEKVNNSSGLGDLSDVEQNLQKMMIVSAATFSISGKTILTKNGTTIPVTVLPDADRNYPLTNIIDRFNSDTLSKHRLHALASWQKFEKTEVKSALSKQFDVSLKTEDADAALNDETGSPRQNDRRYGSEVSGDERTDLVTEIAADVEVLDQLDAMKAVHKAVSAAIEEDASGDFYVVIKADPADVGIDGPRARGRNAATSDAADLAPVSDTIEIRTLSRGEQLQRIRDNTNSEAFVRDPHKCFPCGASFKTTLTYDRHMARHEKGHGDWQCDVCPVFCPTRQSLHQHQRNCHRLEFKCKLCGLKMPSRDKARQHSCDPDKRPPVCCDICNKDCRSKKYLLIHKLNKHKSDDCVCSICNAKFPNVNGLRVHMSVCKNRVMQCPSCPRKFRNARELLIHERTHAPVARVKTPRPPAARASGDESPRAVASRRARQLHATRGHGPRAPARARFHCAECDRHFSTKGNYTVHMTQSVRHVDPAQFKYHCDRCPRTFAVKGGLTAHMESHLKTKRLRCRQCDFVTWSYGNYRRHMRFAHTGGLPRNSVCSYCGLRYECNAKLLIHVRSHTNEKPFACDVCAKTFASKGILKEHILGVHLKNLPKKARRKKMATQSEN